MKQTKEISIKDVARLAGVSPATVSRVMNGTAKVEQSKHDLVLKLIEETGFVPNQIARSLYKKSSQIIGYIIPSMLNPFFSELGKYIEDALFEKNYKLIICNSDGDEKKERDYLEMLRSMNADGVILATNNTDSLHSAKIPIIAIDRELEQGNAVIHSNHYQGGRLQTEHLLSRGCKQIVCLRNPLKISSASLRFDGYVDVCKENNLEIRYIDCEYSFEDGVLKTQALLDSFPQVDGIIASNDMVALGVYKCLCENKIKVPEDIKLIGFDNISLSAVTTPSLTTIAQPLGEMGRLATKMLLDMIEGKENIEKKQILDVTLIVRQTT